MPSNQDIYEYVDYYKEKEEQQEAEKLGISVDELRANKEHKRLMEIGKELYEKRRYEEDMIAYYLANKNMEVFFS